MIAKRGTRESRRIQSQLRFEDVNGECTNVYDWEEGTFLFVRSFSIGGSFEIS